MFPFPISMNIVRHKVDNRNPSYRKRGPCRKHRQGLRDLDRAVRPAGLNGLPIGLK